jgi:hypothetical protein
MSFWGLFGKAVTGPMKDVSGIAKDVTEIKKNLVERKLAEKHLTDEESLISKPTLEDVKRFDPQTKRIVRAAEIVEDFLARNRTYSLGLPLLAGLDSGLRNTSGSSPPYLS